MDGYAVRAADTAGASTDAPVALRVVGELAGRARADDRGRAGRGDPHHDRRADARRRRRGRDGRAHATPTATTRRVVERRRAGRSRAAARAATSRPAQLVFDAGHRAHARAPRRAREPRRRRGARVTRGRGSACCSTGDELVRAGPLAPGQIRDSNRPMLLALLEEAGCEPVDFGIARDDEAAHHRDDRATPSTRATRCVTSGAVSIGDYDFVKVVLERVAGARRHVRVDAGRDQAGQAARVRVARRRARCSACPATRCRRA